MKITKIKIKNLFGIKEAELDGKSIELSGTNGVGKTSFIHAIEYGLTNSSQRDLILKKGEEEGEIIIETDTALRIDRKKRNGKTDYKSIKDNGAEVQSPEAMLKQLFTPLQLEPVQFLAMDKNEQNRMILDLIEFDWDINWIKEKFGEIPSWVDYEQNILQVLNDIQDENGDYFKERQNINRDKRNKIAFIEDIGKDLPTNYNAEKWEGYDIGSAYKELESIREANNKINRAKAFKETYDNKLRGLEADRDIQNAAEEKSIASERDSLTSTISRLMAEIKSTEEKLEGLDDKLADKKRVVQSKFNECKAKLEKDMKVADDYINREIIDFSELQNEIETAEQMKKHLNEYNRMVKMEDEVDELEKISQSYTEKIELARTLPGEILQTAKLPLKGLTVEGGIPKIDGLPISNLSEGEKLDLCVDIALSKPSNLQIILIDGIEKLSEENRDKLYSRCRESGLQFIASRTTDSKELEVRYL